jgi:hypothetical protein
MHLQIKPLSYPMHKLKSVRTIEQQVAASKVHNSNYRSICVNSFSAPAIPVATVFKGLVTSTSAKSNNCRKGLCLNFISRRHRLPLSPGDLTAIAATLAKKCPNLKRLTIALDDPSHQISNTDAKNFALAVKKMKHLEVLTLDFMDEIMASEYAVAKLIGIGRPARELKEFNLILDEEVEFGHLAWVSLASSLKHKVNLTRLTIVAENAMTHQHLLTLAPALATLAKLTFLDLCFSFHWGYHGLTELSDSLASLANLKQLKLDLLSVGDAVEDDASMEISDQEVVQLATAIGNLAQLACLSLMLMPGYELTNISLESLGANLAKLTNLTKVYLTLDSGELGEGSKHLSASGIKMLMSGLHNQTNLTTLNVWLRGGMQLEPVAYFYLAKSNPNLTTYSLQLYSLSFSDSCFQALATGLGELSNLKHLELKVVTAQELALNGLIAMINSLYRLHALQTIDIILIVIQIPQNELIDVKLLQARMEHSRDILPNLQRFSLELWPGQYNVKNYCKIEVKRSPPNYRWQTDTITHKNNQSASLQRKVV